MSTTSMINETAEAFDQVERPGAQLARAREEKGYTQEFVAGKLYLLVRVIELLEADDYASMPEPVFIKGYLRAYANLLDLDPAPLLRAYNHFPLSSRTLDRTIWQAKREAPRGIQTLRWLTATVALGVLIMVGVWWHKNKENMHLSHKAPEASAQLSTPDNAEDKKSSHLALEREMPKDKKLKLTDLSKMQILLPVPQNGDGTLSLGQHRE